MNPFLGYKKPIRVYQGTEIKVGIELVWIGMIHGQQNHHDQDSYVDWSTTRESMIYNISQHKTASKGYKAQLVAVLSNENVIKETDKETKTKSPMLTVIY